MAADVGAEAGTQGPWWRDRTVSVGGMPELVEEAREEAAEGPRRGCRARKAMKGYVVT